MRDHGPCGGAPHDGVVDHHEALAGDVLAQRVELQAHAAARSSWLGAMNVRPM
jgi:hypothetical protein